MAPRWELLERYRIAHQEMRDEIGLGHQRGALFVVLTSALTAFAPAGPHVASMALASALCGIHVVQRSHTRYRLARNALVERGQALEIDDLITTNGIMRQARGYGGDERMRVTTAVTLLLAFHALVAGTILASG